MAGLLVVVVVVVAVIVHVRNPFPPTHFPAPRKIPLTPLAVSSTLPLAMAYESVIQALADPTRRTIFERLRSGPMPVGRVAEGLPVSRPAVSQHLRVLKDAGLVE